MNAFIRNLSWFFIQLFLLICFGSDFNLSRLQMVRAAGSPVQYLSSYPGDFEAAWSNWTSLRKCNTPTSSPSYKFNRSQCMAIDGAFPAPRAECPCTNCKENLRLVCHEDGLWYPSEDSFCENSKKCEKCPNDVLPPSLFLPLSRGGGHSNEVRKFSCKSSCQQVYIKCSPVRSRKGNRRSLTYAWALDEVQNTLKEKCADNSEFTGKNRNLLWTFSKGVYNYSCKPGYILKVNPIVTCENSVFSAIVTNDDCVRDPLATTTPKSTTTRQVTKFAVKTTKVPSKGTTQPSTEVPITIVEVMSTSDPTKEDRGHMEDVEASKLVANHSTVNVTSEKPPTSQIQDPQVKKDNNNTWQVILEEGRVPKDEGQVIMVCSILGGLVLGATFVVLIVILAVRRAKTKKFRASRNQDKDAESPCSLQMSEDLSSVGGNQQEESKVPMFGGENNTMTDLEEDEEYFYPSEALSAERNAGRKHSLA